jgi:catechol 2,3-dioxygenase-like lactoylglutathione lyase family enzyme
MNTEHTRPPLGPGGLRYGVSQVSLTVRDLDPLVELYHETFGWAPWKVYDHVEPVHHDTVLRGEPVEYSLRGAEVQVGSLNFELLQPLSGPNIWSEQLDATGEGICSIATMFHTRDDGDWVRDNFRDALGIDELMRAEIGDHIEYYYLDTTQRFGIPIESGSGHALDFMKPLYDYPSADAEWDVSPAFGVRMPIVGISVVVTDLDAKLSAYADGLGWKDWAVLDTAEGVMSATSFGAGPADWHLRWAETAVGDLTVELIEPLGGKSPWQEFIERRGEGLVSVSIGLSGETELARIVEGFAQRGVAVLAQGLTRDQAWVILDSVDTYRCLIKLCTGSGSGSSLPDTTTS